MDETIRLYWLDDENIFGFDVDTSLLSVHPIRSPDELLDFAPSQTSSPQILEGDVIICDFKLVPEPERATKAVLDVGLDIDAAGFLAGLLLAIGNKRNPLAVVPYSGEHAQFDALWKLIKTFCPPWIVVGEGFHTHDKSQSDLMQIINTAIQAYRDLIRKQFEDGNLQFDQVDRRKILALRSPEIRKNETLSVHETVSFVRDGVRRSIKVGSLFYDEVKERVQASELFTGSRGELEPIVDYFTFLPDESPSEVAARELCNRFIDEALSDRSCDIYEGAITGDPMTIPEAPSGWLGSQTADPEVRRFALLRAFVAAFCAGRTVPGAIGRLCDLIAENEPSRIDSYRTTDVPCLLNSHGLANEKDVFFHRVLQNYIQRWNLETSSDLAGLGKYCRSLLDSPEDLKSALSWKFIQFLEPIPKDVVGHINLHGRYGAGLRRHLLDAREDVKFSPMELLTPLNIIRIKLPERDSTYVEQCVLEFIPAGLPRPNFMS